MDHRQQRIRDEVREELEFHLDEVCRELVEAGLTPEQAREKARARFGDFVRHQKRILELYKAHEKGNWRTLFLEPFLQSLRHAWRGAFLRPGFSLAVILTLGLGVGVNAILFNVVDRLLLRPPDHVENPQEVRLFYLDRRYENQRVVSTYFTYPDYLHFRNARSFDDLAAIAWAQFTLDRGPEGSSVWGQMVTPSFFSVLGVQPELGRFFGKEDDTAAATPTVVLSHHLWLDRYGGDPSVLGRRILVGDLEAEVIGVTPLGFTGADIKTVDLWLPLELVAGNLYGTVWRQNFNYWWIFIAGRLAPGASAEAASQELTTLHRQISAEQRKEDHDPQARIEAASLIAARGPDAPGEARVTLWLAATALLVLVIACVNVANLLLARILACRHELALRSALGGRSRHLLIEVLGETLFLSLSGAVLAFLFAWSGSRIIQKLLLPGFDWSSGAVTPRMLLVTLVLAVVGGCVTGLLPALSAIRLASPAFSSASRISPGRSRISSWFLMVQAALSVLLLIGAGLFVASFQQALQVDLGFEPEGVSVLTPVWDSPAEPGEQNRRMGDLLEIVQNYPGVGSAAATSSIPFRDSWALQVRLPGKEFVRTAGRGPYFYLVSGRFFDTLRLEIQRGRSFKESDHALAERVAIINRQFAASQWPGGDAVGECLLIGNEESPPCTRVVGIVENSSRQALDEEPNWLVYLPAGQSLERPLHSIYSRADSGSPSPPGLILDAYRKLPDLRYLRQSDFTDFVAPHRRAWQLGAFIFSAFGVLALGVASFGLYSTLSYSVSMRLKELGIRSALGARTLQLLRMIVLQGLAWVVPGILTGLLLAGLFSDRLSRLLFRTSPFQPEVYLAVAGIVLAASLLAALLPGLRATRVDPARILRGENTGRL